MQVEKPFYELLVKERSIFNPFRYIFGEVHVFFGERSKYPNIKTAVQYYIDNLDLDVKDIKIIKKK